MQRDWWKVMWRFPFWLNFISFIQSLLLHGTWSHHECNSQIASHMPDPEWWASTMWALTWFSLHLPIDTTLNSFFTEVNISKMYLTSAIDYTAGASARVQELKQRVLSVPSREGAVRNTLGEQCIHCTIKFTMLVNLLKPPLPQKNKDCPLWQFLDNLLC